MTTHTVTNQPPPLAGRNLFTDNRPLVEALEREGGGAHVQRVGAVGAAWGGEPMDRGVQANEHPPILRTHDRYAHRIDEVEFHPAWHQLMALGSRHELHTGQPLEDEPRRAADEVAGFLAAHAG